MIVLRLATGITEHFPQRVSEWVMTAAILGWGYMLAGEAAAFSATPSFRELSRIADEDTWALICLLVGMARLAALIVNGTFRGFRYSPHLRGAASLVACVFWGQITLGMLVAWIGAGAIGTGVVAYGAFMTLELWNLFRAWADVGASRQARVKRNGHSG